MRHVILLMILYWQCALPGSYTASGTVPSSYKTFRPLRGIQDDTTCPNNFDVHQSPVISKDRGALNSLLSTAQSTRENSINRVLPYSSIGAEISKVYNRSALNFDPYLRLWVDYSQNALYLAGFVLFVGVVFPIVIVSLWTFWECCYETNEEEEGVENRSITLSSQVIAWTLASIILILLLLLCVFVCILLAGNSWMSTGVSEGGTVVRSILPELARIRDQSLAKVERVLLTDYEMLQLELYADTLDLVVPQVKECVRNNSIVTMNGYYMEVLSDLQSGSSLYQHAQRANDALSSILSMDSVLQTLIGQLNHTLIDLKRSCIAIENSTVVPLNSSLLSECVGLLEYNETNLFPRTRHDVISLGGVEGNQSLLSRLVELFSQVADFDLEMENIDAFQVYLDTNLTAYLNNSIRAVSDRHLGTNSDFNQSLVSFLNDTVQFYTSSLTFGLPQSQEQLEGFLGPQFLSNWEVFRYGCTLTFALIVLLLGVCLLVTMGRGLLDLLVIYNGGDDLTHSEGAHQAGTMLKKVAFCFAGVCVVSSVSFGVFLSMNGVLGPVCGTHNNFTMAIMNVIDNKDTWGGIFPLGLALIGNSSYPLTVQSVLDECRQNHSLYVSLQLVERLDLDAISFSEMQEMNYLDEMRAISTTIPHFEPLSTEVSNLLHQLQEAASLPVQWAELQSLTADGIFVEEFIGLRQLWQIVQSMELALLDTQDISADVLTASDISTTLNTTELAVRSLTNYIDQELISVVYNSTVALEEGQMAINNSAQLLSEVPTLTDSVNHGVIVETRTQLSLASHAANSQLKTFTSSSRQTLQCQTGVCLSLALKFDQFSSSFCTDVVPGLDVFWTTLILILTLSLLILPLALVLAGRFINLEVKKSMAKKFHLTSSVIRQCRAIFWLVLSLSICLWLTVAVFVDDYFQRMFCQNGGSGCCSLCVGVFGALFLLLAALVGGVSRVYQCVIIYRITKCESAKVKRFWIDRKKAIQFYTQLFILLFQDVPFLILAGTYANGITPLPISAFFTIVVSLTGIVSYIVCLLQERTNILSYFVWLKKLCTTCSCYNKIGNQADITNIEGVANGRSNGGVPMVPSRGRSGRYGSSESEQSDDSQGTTTRDGDWHYSHNQSNTTGNHRLSNIPEQPESLDLMNRGLPQLSSSSPNSFHSPSSPPGRSSRTLPPPFRVNHLDDDESYIELSQVQPTTSTVMLDNFDTVNHNETALQLRREAAIHQRMGGIDMASRHVDYESSTDFGSITSIPVSELPGYYSSQPPDDNYESSDYREDYDSDYSQVLSQRSRYTLRPNGTMGEVSVDV